MFLDDLSDRRSRSRDAQPRTKHRTGFFGRCTRVVAIAATGVMIASGVAAIGAVTTTSEARADYASGGTGQHGGSVDWFSWGEQGSRLPNEGMTKTNTREVGGQTLSTTCTIASVSSERGQDQPLYAYRSGNFAGDSHDDLYNIGGTGTNNQLVDGLGNFASGDGVSFSFACSASLDGTAVPLAGLVMADAEQSTEFEYIQAEIETSATWRIIDRYRSPECTGSTPATLTSANALRIDGVTDRCESGPGVTAFMDGATSAEVVLKGGGRSAIALGVALYTDFGDAPASYGDAGALYSPPFAGGTVPVGTTLVSGDDFALASFGQPETRLGATIDAEGGSQYSEDASADEADEDGASNVGSVTARAGDRYTQVVACAGAGSVAGWIDWNANGSFDDSERSDVATCTGDSVTLSWTVPADFVTSNSFMRLRIGPDAASVSAPIGITTAGEVEDYALTVFASTAWECDAYGYLFQSPNGVSDPHQFYQVDLVTGASSLSGTTANNVNGVGYNTLDDYVYGFITHPGSPIQGHLVRIGADGSQTDLGSPAGLPSGSGFNVGDFDDAGHLWVTTSMPGGAPWAEIDLAPGSSTYGTVIASGTQNAANGIGSDWSYLDGAFYGVTPIAGIGHLIRFDAATHAVTDTGALVGANAVTGVGATYTDASGYLYAQDNASGNIHRIDVSTRESIHIAVGPQSSSNDGARCATAPIPTITVNKAVDGRYAADDQFTVGLGNVAGTTVTSATTTGTSASVSTADWPVSQGATYTITDAMAAGSASTMDKYTASAVCVAEDGSTATLEGAAPSWSLTVTNPTAYDCTVTNTPSVPPLKIEKISDATSGTRIGDTVTYTVTATNPGPAAYPADNPAVVSDSLAEVLDDATYNDDVTANLGDAPSYTEPTISWSGALAAGQSVVLKYSVTLKSGGNGQLRNVAWQPPTGGGGGAPECDPATAEGTDPVTGEPCAATEFDVPSLTIAKTANTTELPADGATIEYTVIVTNTSVADFTADAPGTASDDLSNVLDDGALTDGPAASVGTATFDENGQKIDWSGALQAGESATITYSVTYDANKSGGDHVLLNVVCLPAELAADSSDLCRSVQVPGAALQQRKSVNPASGTTVAAGQAVTYTLTFENTGETDATVNTVDDLSNVFDDATLSGDPTVSDPALSAALDGEQLLVTGSVPAGETYTVSYTVTVNAFAEQGDHVLGNVLGLCEQDDLTCRTENPIRHVTVTKAADPIQGANTGDTVTYTVTVVSDGAGDYTADSPALVADDLTGVIDDATFDVSTASATSGALAYTEPLLTWTGPLASGESATITYSVTVTNLGDHNLVNTATPVCADPEICDPPVTVVVPVPHIVPSKASDPADGSDVKAGDVVTYTLSWTNDGQATGPVDSTDDLSNVLDDADITSEPVSSAPEAVTATRTGDNLRVVGDIEPGQTVTVTYQVTVKPNGEHGDNDLANVLMQDVPQLCEDGELCPPPTTDHPVGDLDDWKTVDPASGTTVQPGTVMTYTLHFQNTGTAPVDVARDDDLSNVLDDADVTSVPVASNDSLTVSEMTDGRFTVSGTLESGQNATVTYQVTVKPDGQRGDDSLANFLLDLGQEPPTNAECVPVDGQKPDCTVSYVSNLVVVKSSDPASGTKVESGQSVTYTLTFTNRGSNPKAAPVPVDEIDHMKDVLDDATLTAGPASSDAALSATLDGDTIRVTGALASGQTAEVTYTVQVNGYDKQGNHTLGNVVAHNGNDPICVPDSALCTLHDVTPPAPGLASTGVDLTTSGLLAALLVGLGGLGMLMDRRRSRQMS